jgi:hypothetical protein
MNQKKKSPTGGGQKSLGLGLVGQGCQARDLEFVFVAPHAGQDVAFPDRGRHFRLHAMQHCMRAACFVTTFAFWE